MDSPRKVRSRQDRKKRSGKQPFQTLPTPKFSHRGHVSRKIAGDKDFSLNRTSLNVDMHAFIKENWLGGGSLNKRVLTWTILIVSVIIKNLKSAKNLAGSGIIL
jgi:hypothetical protein